MSILHKHHGYKISRINAQKVKSLDRVMRKSNSKIYSNFKNYNRYELKKDPKSIRAAGLLCFTILNGHIWLIVGRSNKGLTDFGGKRTEEEFKMRKTIDITLIREVWEELHINVSGFVRHLQYSHLKNRSKDNTPNYYFYRFLYIPNVFDFISEWDNRHKYLQDANLADEEVTEVVVIPLDMIKNYAFAECRTRLQRMIKNSKLEDRLLKIANVKS